MQTVWAVIWKVFGVSAVVSVAIKAIGPSLPIPATTPWVLGLVLSPSILMAIALSGRWLNQDSRAKNPSEANSEAN